MSWTLSLSDLKRSSTGSANRLEVKYMRKFERCGAMLDSDGAGGLHDAAGHRSADSGTGVWANVMDEYGNLVTAADRLVWAGMWKTTGLGKLAQLCSSSVHYTPTKTQLQAVARAPRDDCNVDFSLSDVALFERDPASTAVAPLVSSWRAGRLGAFLSGGEEG